MPKSGTKRVAKNGEQKPLAWWKRLDVYALFIASIAMLTGAGNCYYQREVVATTKEQIAVANRPYVAISQILTKVDNNAKKLSFVVELKNTGIGHAHQMTTTSRLLVNGNQLPKLVGEEFPTVFAAQANAYDFGGIEEPHFSMVMSGASALKLEYTVAYAGADGRQYHYRQNATYVPKVQAFLMQQGTAD